MLMVTLVVQWFIFMHLKDDAIYDCIIADETILSSDLIMQLNS